MESGGLLVPPAGRDADYEVKAELPLGGPLGEGREVGELLALLGGSEGG